MVDMGSQTSRMPSVAIEGLQDWQCEDLLLVRKGSLIEVAVYSRVRERERDEESDEDSAQSGDEGEEDASVEEVEVGDENSGKDLENSIDAENMGESSEVNEPDTPPPPPTTTTNPGSELKQLTLTVGELHRAFEVNAAALTSINTDQNGAEAQDGRAQDQALEVAVPGGTYVEADQDQSANGEDEGESDESEDGSADSDGADGEDEDEDDPEEGYSEYEEGGEELWRDLYVVLDVMTADDNSSTVTDLKLRKLTYQHHGEEAAFDTYRIYGKAIKLHDESAALVEGEEAIFLHEIIDAEDGNTFSVALDPSGDHLRDVTFDYQCPANCDDGWQRDMQALRAVYSEDLPDVRPFRPTCPVCVGQDLMNEQMTLRIMLDTASYIDIGQVVEHLGNLNARRGELGYSFVQFDEREWGFGFDDMLDESDYEDDEGRGDGRRFEHWDEAMDPNANPPTRPASENTIAALPKKKYEAVTKKEDGAFCAICQGGAYGEDCVVVELPCGHVYDAGCLESWIREYDTCPECRATVSETVGGKDENAAEGDIVPAENEVNRGASDDFDEEAVLDSQSDADFRGLRGPEGTETKVDGEGNVDGEQVQMDGGDVAMSEVEDAGVTHNEEL